MRLNYYGSDPWDGKEERPPEANKPVPYGPVPGEEHPAPEAPREEAGQPEGLHRRTPNAWTKPPRPKRERRQTSGPRRFGILFALILVLAGTGVLLQGGVEGPRFSSGGLWRIWGQLWDGEASGPDRYFEEEPGEDWLAELKNTTIPRAPTGDGTLLAISALEEGELPLTAREVYQQVIPTVVMVEGTLDYGYSMGTGVIMSSNGYILTNAHIISGCKSVEVALWDDRWVDALLVGYDGESDLAVLKIDARELPVARFGDSAALQVGDVAYAIGNPLGEELRGTMTDGIISAIDRQVYMDDMTMTLIQTTAALNSGNSGGPLVNSYGQVVGITNMKMMSDEETLEGLGFAIPISSAKEVVDQIIAQGSYVGAPLLGVTVVDTDSREGAPAGALIVGIQEGSDAYRKGLRIGQIITRANGMEITNTEDLAVAKEGFGVGDTITLEVWTGRASRVVDVTLMSRNQMAEG